MFIKPSVKEHLKHTFHIGAPIVLANHPFAFLTLQLQDKIKWRRDATEISSLIAAGTSNLVTTQTCYFSVAGEVRKAPPPRAAPRP